MTYFETKGKYKFLILKLIFEITLKMKVSLFFRVLLVFVFSFGNSWAILEDNENDGLHRIPVHRMKRFGQNLTELHLNLRKYNFNNRKHDPKPVGIKQYNFINNINVGEISIGSGVWFVFVSK